MGTPNENPRRIDSGKPVWAIDGARTPFLKARGKPGPFTAADLAVAAGRALLLRQPFEPTDLDEVILGCALPSPDEANIARVAALRMGCGHRVTAWTVGRNCGSGMQALDEGRQRIAHGDSDLVLAGGVEAMSHAPVLAARELLAWIGDWRKTRGWRKARRVAELKLAFFKPVMGLERGLTDPVTGLSMGQTAENLAYRFGIRRDQMDGFALESHRRAAAAQDTGQLPEVVAAVDGGGGGVYLADDGVRRDTDLEQLARLKPAFEPYGLISAGNSAQITDGAAWLLLASDEAVKKYHLPILGRLVGCQWAGVSPAEMGLGPVHAVPPLLSRYRLAPADIDYWEINEAFSAQVLAVLAAWQDANYCRSELGLPTPFGSVPAERLNVDGGAIAMGHPVGASGARIVLHLLHVLRTRRAAWGVAALCIGGGQGGAMLVEADGSSRSGIGTNDQEGEDHELASGTG